MKNRSRTDKRKFFVSVLLGIGAIVLSQTSFGLTFVIPHNGNIVGHLQQTTVQPGDTLSTIGRRYNVGGYEMVEANPGVSYLSPNPGSKVVIPTRYVLPSGTRKGIVINLAEMRLYYYHPDGVHVSTYPVGVGQEGWNTPMGKTTITRKRKDPTWIVPDSIMENEMRHGIYLQKAVPPGPKNPLGPYALTTGLTSIVIHGSPYPKGVGVRSSHGCIRMLNEDVAQLYSMVEVGTPVEIIDQPNKIGRINNQIFLEAHVPLSKASTGYKPIGELLHNAVGESKYAVEWRKVERMRSHATGYPIPIGTVF